MSALATVRMSTPSPRLPGNMGMILSPLAQELSSSLKQSTHHLKAAPRPALPARFDQRNLADGTGREMR